MPILLRISPMSLIPMAHELRSRNFDNDQHFPSDEGTPVR